MVVSGDHLLWHSFCGKSQSVSRFLEPTNFYTILLTHQKENDTIEKNIQNVFLINFNSNVETELFEFIARI